MTVKLSPVGNSAPFVDASGIPLNGGLLYTYLAGSVSTPQTTYSDNAGTVPNSQPIVLNSNGYPASGGNVVEIWLTSGVAYKFVLKTSAGVTVWSRDNISGINDTTITLDEWIAGPAPTYVSATSFTLVGDQTTAFHVGRRLKCTVTAGTAYGTITASVFGALTTVTVDTTGSNALDSGLAAVSYGLLRADNFAQSIGLDVAARQSADIASAGTLNLDAAGGDLVDVTGTTTITAITLARGKLRTVRFTGALTLTNGASLVLPGGANITTAAGDFAILRGYAAGVVRCVSYVKANGNAVVVASGVIEGTSIATTSGTAADFTGLPSTVKRIIVSLNGVSTNSTGALLIQLGSGSVDTSGYVSQAAAADGTSTARGTTGFVITGNIVAANFHSGQVILTRANSSTNVWISTDQINADTGAASGLLYNGAGTKALAGALDRVRLTTIGAATFDAGEVNILYD